MNHTRAHVARAIVEACCCQLRECLDQIAAGGFRVDGIRCLGGAARSDLWLQMKADMAGISVERPKCSEAASMGAAMLAARGVGQFQTVAEASNAWYRASRRFEPNSCAHERYGEVYRRYKWLYTQLYGGPGANG